MKLPLAVALRLGVLVLVADRLAVLDAVNDAVGVLVELPLVVLVVLPDALLLAEVELEAEEEVLGVAVRLEDLLPLGVWVPLWEGVGDQLGVRLPVLLCVGVWEPVPLNEEVWEAVQVIDAVLEAEAVPEAERDGVELRVAVPLRVAATLTVGRDDEEEVAELVAEWLLVDVKDTVG